MISFDIVEFDNFDRFLNKDVKIDIISYDAAIMYPDENVLIGMNEHFYYFRSTEGEYWHFPVTNDNVEITVYIEVDE